jgi:hypothetical protein
MPPGAPPRHKNGGRDADEARRLRERLSAILDDPAHNPAVAYVASYAMARAAAWDGAVGLLGEAPSLAEIWRW